MPWPLAYLQSARSEKKWEKDEKIKKIQIRLAIIDLFEGLWSVGAHFRR